MNEAAVLLFGFGLGMRHATDPDHLVVVSTLLQREPGGLRAARIAALWGLGHSGTFLAVGLSIVLAGLRPPEAFDRFTEIAVGVMLIGLAAWHVLRKPGESKSLALGRATTRRPIAVGLIHGLAGSAGIGLLAATTIGSSARAVLYLGLFGVGTVIGMVAITVVMSRPIAWTMQREGRLRRVAVLVAAALSAALGMEMLLAALG
jgi:nickel/cobalt exporter